MSHITTKDKEGINIYYQGDTATHMICSILKSDMIGWQDMGERYLDIEDIRFILHVFDNYDEYYSKSPMDNDFPDANLWENTLDDGLNEDDWMDDTMLPGRDY